MGFQLPNPPVASASNNALLSKTISYSVFSGATSAQSSFGAQLNNPSWLAIIPSAGTPYSAALKSYVLATGGFNLNASPLSAPSSSNFPFHRGSSARTGGFKCFSLFGTYTANLFADSRFFFGLTSSTFMGTNGANTGPRDAMNDLIGVGSDAADANWQIFSKAGAGAVTALNTGLAKATSQLLSLYLECEPFGSSVFYSFKQYQNDGTETTISEGNLTVNIPAASQFLGYFAGAKAGPAGGTSVAYAFSYMNASIP